MNSAIVCDGAVCVDFKGLETEEGSPALQQIQTSVASESMN